MHNLKVCVAMGYLTYTIATCTLLLSNQSFYWQITSHEKGGDVSGVGQW